MQHGVTPSNQATPSGVGESSVVNRNRARSRLSNSRHTFSLCEYVSREHASRRLAVWPVRKGAIICICMCVYRELLYFTENQMQRQDVNPFPRTWENVGHLHSLILVDRRVHPDNNII
jgi:hypothetical protein